MNTDIANPEDSSPRKKVRIEFKADYLEGGFGETERNFACKIDGFDFSSLRFYITVDCKGVDIDFSKVPTFCEGTIYSWADLEDRNGIYQVNSRIVQGGAEIRFEIDGDFCLDKLLFCYEMAINPDGEAFKVLTNILYDDYELEIWPLGPYYKKSCHMWIIEDNRFAPVKDPEVVSYMLPEDKKWRPFPPFRYHFGGDGNVVIDGYRKNECAGSMTIPATIGDCKVVRIGRGAFAGCEELKRASIPIGVTIIGAVAFARCNKLTSVTLRARIKSIGSGAFEDCAELSHIRIPSGVKDIGSRTFCGCKKLTNIIIPDSVDSIGFQAFHGCESLSSVTVPKKTQIAEGAFDANVTVLRK